MFSILLFLFLEFYDGHWLSIFSFLFPWRLAFVTGLPVVFFLFPWKLVFVTGLEEVLMFMFPLASQHYQQAWDEFLTVSMAQWLGVHG